MTTNAMHGFLFLGDSVTQHSDGTISVARGGIARIDVAKDQVAVVPAGLFARVKAPAGPHRLRIDVVLPDGAEPPLDLTGQPFPTSFPLDIKVDDPKVAVHVVAQFQMAFRTRGTYVFKLVVDDQLLDAWDLIVADLATPVHSVGVPAEAQTS